MNSSSRLMASSKSSGHLQSAGGSAGRPLEMPKQNNDFATGKSVLSFDDEKLEQNIKLLTGS